MGGTKDKEHHQLEALKIVEKQQGIKFRIELRGSEPKFGQLLCDVGGKVSENPYISYNCKYCNVLKDLQGESKNLQMA